MTIQQKQNKNLSDTELLAFAYIISVRKGILNKLKRILETKPSIRNILLKRLLKQNSILLSSMYNPVNSGIINSYNIASIGYSKQFSIAPSIIRSIPNEKAFEITNRYLKKSAIVRRGLINSKDLNKIIKKGSIKGWGYDRTAKEIEFKLGYINGKGQLTKGIGKNGIHYQTTRIARQETRRANGIAQYDSLVEANKTKIRRLQLKARIIATSRNQSITMNNQKDGEPYGSHGGGKYNPAYAGKFQYPDGGWYVFGQAPVRWSINDREYVINA